MEQEQKESLSNPSDDLVNDKFLVVLPRHYKNRDTVIYNGYVQNGCCKLFKWKSVTKIGIIEGYNVPTAKVAAVEKAMEEGRERIVYSKALVDFTIRYLHTIDKDDENISWHEFCFCCLSLL